MAALGRNHVHFCAGHVKLISLSCSWKSTLIEAKENFVNYYGGKELAESFRTVRKNTLAIAQDIPEDKYDFRPMPESRSVGELLAHIALSHAFQKKINAEERRTNLDGFDFPALMKRMRAEEKEPRTKAQLIELLTKEGEAWAKWMEGLDENFLGEVITMPPGGTPPSRTRFDMILSVKEARNASPRPVDADRANAGNRASPHPPNAGTQRRARSEKITRRAAGRSQRPAREQNGLVRCGGRARTVSVRHVSQILLPFSPPRANVYSSPRRS